MKRYLFLALLILLSMTMTYAGELQTLHHVLAEPQPEVQEKPQQPFAAPEGTMLVPGQTLAPAPTFTTDIREIGLERTRCYADCPAYTFIIQRDGSFRYVGEYGVEHLGEYTGQVSQGRLNQVLRYIEAIDFMDLQDTYSSPFLDNAAVYTMVVKNGNTKVIENYALSGPATLWALEQLIDSLLETAQWNEQVEPR